MAGAAICTIGAAPAFAGSAPHFNVVALHGGAVTKSVMHTNTTNVTYTISVATSVSVASGYKVPTKLAATYYTFQSNGSICQAPKKEKVKLAAKKTKYAKLSTSTETYSEGCSSGPTTFYGDVYDLIKKSGKNKTDSFVSTLTADFTSSGTKYKGTLNLDVGVSITP